MELVKDEACMAPSAWTSAPGRAAARPGTCSSKNGFLFCGIAELEPTSYIGQAQKVELRRCPLKQIGGQAAQIDRIDRGRHEHPRTPTEIAAPPPPPPSHSSPQFIP